MKKFLTVYAYGGLIGILVGLCWLSNVLFADTEETIAVLPSSNIRVVNLPLVGSGQYTTDEFAFDDLSREEQIALMKECVSDGLECAKFKSHPPEIMMLTRLFWEYRTRGR